MSRHLAEPGQAFKIQNHFCPQYKIINISPKENYDVSSRPPRHDDSRRPVTLAIGLVTELVECCPETRTVYALFVSCWRCRWFSWVRNVTFINEFPKRFIDLFISSFDLSSIHLCTHPLVDPLTQSSIHPFICMYMCFPVSCEMDEAF